MGRMKELLMQNWVEEEHQKIVKERNGEISMVYADLIDFDKVDNCSMIYIEMINNTVHMIPPSDIIVVHGLSISYRKSDKEVVTLPLDKVISVTYGGIEK